MLTEVSTPNNWTKKPTKVQEKEDPVAVSEEEEYSDSDADSDGCDLASFFAKKPKIQEKEDPVAVSDEEEYSDFDGDGSEDSVDSEMNEDDESYIRHRQEKAELIVTDFLDKVQKNEFDEFNWPPPPKCPTHKLGLTSPYTTEFCFEKEESFSGEEYDTAKKYLHQVRTSWGYDVDCIPPKWFRPRNFFPIDMKDERYQMIYGEDVSTFADHAIKRINNQAKEIGKTFELVKTEKAVGTATTMLLLTLTVKETSSDAEKAIRVAVSSPFGCGPEIVECHLIPSLSST